MTGDLIETLPLYAHLI